MNQQVTGNRAYGSHNRIGVFYGLDEEKIAAMLEEQMKGFIGLTEEQHLKTEALLSDKADALLLSVPLALTHSEEAITTQIKANAASLQDSLTAWASTVQAAIEGLGGDQKAISRYLDLESRAARAHAAKALLKLTDIEEAISNTENAAGLTYGEILKQGMVLKGIEDTVSDCHDEIEQLVDGQKEAQALLSQVKEGLNAISRACFEGVNAEDYDDLVFARQNGIRFVQSKKDDICDQLSTTSAEDLLRNGFSALQEQIHTEIAWLHGKLLPLHENKIDCVFCRTPKTRVYTCQCCGYSGGNDDAPHSVWEQQRDAPFVHRGDYLLVNGGASGEVNLTAIRDSLYQASFARDLCSVKAMLFSPSVKSVAVKGKESITALFPRLKSVGFAARDGVEGCFIGKGVFAHAHGLAIYGAEAIKDCAAGAFKGFFANEEEARSFLGQAPTLKAALCKHAWQNDWRT